MTCEPTKPENGEVPTSEASAPVASSVVEEVAGPRRLHVTNLPFRMKNEDLQKIFGEFGEVDEAEIIYNERGSKGFGFVTMVRSDDAKTAREALNHKEFDGRSIEVNNATPRQGPKGVFRGKSSGRPREGYDNFNRQMPRSRYPYHPYGNYSSQLYGRYQGYDMSYKGYYGSVLPYQENAMGFAGYGQGVQYMAYGTQQQPSVYPVQEQDRSHYDTQQQQHTPAQSQQATTAGYSSSYYQTNSSYRYQPY